MSKKGDFHNFGLKFLKHDGSPGYINFELDTLEEYIPEKDYKLIAREFEEGDWTRSCINGSIKKMKVYQINYGNTFSVKLDKISYDELCEGLNNIPELTDDIKEGGFFNEGVSP